MLSRTGPGGDRLRPEGRAYCEAATAAVAGLTFAAADRILCRLPKLIGFVMCTSKPAAAARVAARADPRMLGLLPGDTFSR